MTQGPKRRRRCEPTSIAEIIQDAYPDRSQARFIAIAYWWDKALPARVAANARPMRLQKGVLTVHVTSSVWANELQYLREVLFSGLPSSSPMAAVRDFRFRVAPLPPRPSFRSSKSKIRLSVEGKPGSLAKLPEDLARTIARVRNDPLREAITAAALSSFFGTARI